MTRIENVIAHKESIVTSDDIYNKIYATQFIELTKNMMSFLVATLFVKLLNVSILDTIADDRIVTIIFLVMLIFFTVYIALELFTYLKIKSNKDEYLSELTK